MSPEIKYNASNVPHEFNKKFVWYLDNIGEPSRREAVKAIATLIDRSHRTVETWVSRQVPREWKLILRVLEEEYGAPPKNLK